MSKLKLKMTEKNGEIKCKIIETELLRKNLYNNIIEKVSEKLKKYLQQKEIQHFILRYIFNKIIERRSENDPIFIPEYSDICYIQVQKDFEFKDIKIDTDEFIVFMDDLLKDAENKIKKTCSADDAR